MYVSHWFRILRLRFDLEAAAWSEEQAASERQGLEEALAAAEEPFFERGRWFHCFM